MLVLLPSSSCCPCIRSPTDMYAGWSARCMSATRSRQLARSVSHHSRSLHGFSHAPGRATRSTTSPLTVAPQQLRRYVQQRFEPFVPPSPASLGRAKPAKYYPRSQKWGRRLFYVSAVTGILYLVDTQLYAASITRSLRTFGLGIVVATDYKLNFRAYPLLGGTIADLHRRNAERMFNLLHQNGGLYLKVFEIYEP